VAVEKAAGGADYEFVVGEESDTADALAEMDFVVDPLLTIQP
jgi:hypothetical protein